MNTHTPPQPPPATWNTAGPGATVGMQAHNIHHANVYQYGLDASPQEKYAVGLSYLEDGVPREAERLISEVIHGGLDNAEVRFHWLLAMFSKRSYRDLSRVERDHLEEAAKKFGTYPTDDEYTAALEAVRELLDHLLHETEGEVATAEKQILELPQHLLAKVDQHLGLVLSGVTKDKLWEGTKERARVDRYGHDRSSRVWAYFHPVPIPPRFCLPLDGTPVPPGRYRAVMGLIVFVLAVASLGWLVLTSANPVAIVAYPLAVAACAVAVRDAFEWRYSAARIRLEDRRHFGVPAVDHPRQAGFASDVSRSFEWYFARYRPREVDAGTWLAETAGIRGYLRSEIAYVYRESRISVGRVNWLIGHLATDVRRRWLEGTLYDYRARYQVARATKVRCGLSLAVALVVTIVLVQAVAQAWLIVVWPVVVVAAITGWYAAVKWYRIVSARRGYRDDHADAQQRYESRMNAYESWKQRLDATRPKEREMETWLRCDITALIDETLRHYRLSWRDVISHAVLRGPAKGRVRRRVPRGPWRYSRYDLRLFLVTKDGVREVSSELAFKDGVFKDQARKNFRFEAISSVNVDEGADGSRDLVLTLTNGPARSIRVTEETTTETDPGDIPDGTPEDTPAHTPDETPEELLEMNLDAAGFNHALRILEGIGADGKGWIDRDKY